jgi:hypothetical protein
MLLPNAANLCTFSGKNVHKVPHDRVSFEHGLPLPLSLHRPQPDERSGLRLNQRLYQRLSFDNNLDHGGQAEQVLLLGVNEALEDALARPLTEDGLVDDVKALEVVQLAVDLCLK